MAEDPSNPPDPPRGDASDPTYELDVEAALAEAAGLSKELGEEIGTADLDADPGGGDEDVRAEDVEDRLDEVEGLLAEVAGEGADGSSAADSAVEAAPIETDPAADDQVGDDDATVANVAESKAVRASGTDLGDSVDCVVPSAAGVAAPGDARIRDSLGMTLRSVGDAARWRAAAVLESMGRFLLSALDRVDLLFSWIGLKARRVIGWIALALFTAACSITIYSLSH